MLSVHILAVGKLKESYLRQASAEYQKRLGAFCKLTITEIEEYKLPDRPSRSPDPGGDGGGGKADPSKTAGWMLPRYALHRGKTALF